ncbi:MAG: NUDIX domain-containing protein [Chloroflexi bacterium]|nr:NUDIX domain-containing protein [Chloroflexota bacterium]
MSTRRSGGILLYRRLGSGLEVLLAHPGGPFFARKDAGCWTIPKGQPDDEDDLWRVAEREFGEETGHRLADVRLDGAEPIELGTVVLGSGKVVHGWAVEGDLDPAAVVSNDFEVEWPPRSGHRQRYPEIDRVAWLAPPEARRRIHPAQAAFLDRLDAELAP